MSLKIDTAISTSTATPEPISSAVYANKAGGMYEKLKDGFLRTGEVNLTEGGPLTPERVQNSEGHAGGDATNALEPGIDKNTALNLLATANEQTVSVLNGSHRSGRTVSVLDGGAHAIEPNQTSGKSKL